MKKRFIAALCLALLAVSLAATAFAAEPEIMPCYDTKKYTVVEDTGIYTAAREDKRLEITTIPKGDNVTLIAFINVEWMQVRYGTVTGYIKRANAYPAVSIYTIKGSDNVPIYKDTTMDVELFYVRPGTMLLCVSFTNDNEFAYVKVLSGAVADEFNGESGYIRTSDITNP